MCSVEAVNAGYAQVVAWELALCSRLALAFAFGTLSRFPPVPVVTVTDVTRIHFHFDASRNDGGSCKAVWTWKCTHINKLHGEADWGIWACLYWAPSRQSEGLWSPFNFSEEN